MTRQPQNFSWDLIKEGFEFKLPGRRTDDRNRVFGITGVGASELFMYPYWCLEKGYARFTGPVDGTPQWRSRANRLDPGHERRYPRVDGHFIVWPPWRFICSGRGYCTREGWCRRPTT
jgi:hypothetical protein